MFASISNIFIEITCKEEIKNNYFETKNVTQLPPSKINSITGIQSERSLSIQMPTDYFLCHYKPVSNFRFVISSTKLR